MHVGILGVALLPGPIAVSLAALSYLTGEPSDMWGWIEPLFRRPSQALWVVPYLAGGAVFAVVFMRREDR